jgi:hypothetical protein
MPVGVRPSINGATGTKQRLVAVAGEDRSSASFRTKANCRVCYKCGLCSLNRACAVFGVMRLFCTSLLLLFSTPLTAQTFAAGVKGGLRFTDDLDTYWADSESKRYVVGPMAAVGFGHGFSVEVDALYRRVGYRTTSTGLFIGEFSTTGLRGNSWEFPMLLRKSLWRGFYGAAGYAPRVIHGSGHTTLVQIASLDPRDFTHLEFDVAGTWDTTHGAVGGAGFEKRIGRLRVAPEVRYIFWNKPAVEEYGSRGFTILSSQHQVDVLIGITWH